MQRLSMHLAAARRRRELVASRHPRWCRRSSSSRDFRRPGRLRLAFTITDLLVILALVPLGMMLALSCVQQHHDSNSRVRCASNLRQIGQAILLYANDNKGAYPRTFATTGPTVTPVWGTGAASTQPFGELGPQSNDVTAGLFLLLRTQDIGAQVFTCPSTDATPWDFGGDGKTAMNWSNWDGREGIKQHLSYSYQNPYPDDAAVATQFRLASSMNVYLALAADKNPGLASGELNVLSVTTTSSARDMKLANSRNHDRDGQNVLYSDGHVEFQQNPFVGVKRHNIYARRAASTGFASAPPPIGQSPYDADDSVLLPTEE
jgi:prepilin-type processing-associated H-X9-DG protein